MSVRITCPGRLDALNGLLGDLNLAGTLLYLHDGHDVLACNDGAVNADAFDAARGRAERVAWSDNSGRVWRAIGVALGAQNRAARLYVALEAGRNWGNKLALLARLVEHDWRQSESIESLSLELGNRYEELNLLYGVDSSAETTLEHPLDRIVATAMRHCVEFLDIDAACVWAPAYGLKERAYSAVYGAIDSLSADDFDDSLLKLMRTHRAPLVLNGAVGDPTTVQGMRSPCRVVAAPISQGSRQVAGVMLLKREFKHGPFTNSDRRLAQVLAAEITKFLDARFDTVTGLMNREAFEKFQFSGPRWRNTSTAALAYIDIDQFKLINEACGHEAGDRLLNLTARLLRKTSPAGATVARLGADEFAVLMPEFSTEQTRELAANTQNMLNEQRFIEHDKSFQITASIGVAGLDGDYDLSRALTESELACQAAKELGGARVRIYEKADEEVVARHSELRWATEIRSALEENRFELFGQAICRTADPDGVPAHYEVLLRMYDEEATMVSPAIFIPAAERFGLIARIDRAVMTQAIAVLDDCRARDIDIKLTINLSGASLGDEEFRDFARHIMTSSNIQHGALSFEITETAAISNIGQAMSFIAEMKEFGCRFLLDDFGAGMSSYSYLRQFPVEYVKIDGSFVKNIDSDEFNRSIVESIHHICHAGGKRTVAEFVESDAILAVLQEIGVDYVQGYRLDRPAPLQEKIDALAPAIRAAG